MKHDKKQFSHLRQSFWKEALPKRWRGKNTDKSASRVLLEIDPAPKVAAAVAIEASSTGLGGGGGVEYSRPNSLGIPGIYFQMLTSYQ